MTEHRHEFKKSSALTYCDYHHKENKLELGFSSGGSHHYHDVPVTVFDGIKAADENGSPGQYFHQNIRNKYQSTKKAD